MDLRADSVVEKGRVRVGVVRRWRLPRVTGMRVGGRILWLLGVVLLSLMEIEGACQQGGACWLVAERVHEAWLA